MALSIVSIAPAVLRVGDTATLTIDDPAGSVSLSTSEGSVAVDFQNSTTVQFTVFDPKTFGALQTHGYESDVLLTADDGSTTSSINFQITPDVGHYYETIASIDGIYLDDAGVAIADRAYGFWVSGTGTADLATGIISSPGGGTFRYWIQDDTDDRWGPFADEILVPQTSLRSLLPQRSSSYEGKAFVGTIGTFITTLENLVSNTVGIADSEKGVRPPTTLRAILAQRTTSYVGKEGIDIEGTFITTLENLTSNTVGTVESDLVGTFITTLGNLTSITCGKIDEAELELPVSTRIQSILTRARDTLADPNKKRWSDERLLRLLDEAQQDVAKQSQLLKGVYDLSLVIGQAEYDLPDDVWLITRATFDDYEIPLKSYDKMDEEAIKFSLSRSGHLGVERTRGYSVNVDCSYRRANWEVAEGSSIEALIFDNRNLQSIRVFPIPDDSIASESYTFDNAAEPEFDGDEVLGIVTGITDYTFNQPHGIVTDLFDPSVQNEIFNSPYGVVTEITESEVAIKIWYIKMPGQITKMSDELELPRMFDVALKHYVVGNALRDDIEAQYRQMGNECLEMYNRELGIAKDTSSSDGTKNPTNFTTTYRGGFEG